MAKDLSDLNIDACLCISLKTRKDRQALILESFKDSGLDIEFFLVDKDEEDPQRGCYDSHRACAKTILERGYKRALVLEDDCVLEDFSSKTVSRINRFLDTNNPEVFYLGVLLGRMWLTWQLGIARCRAQGAHAYIVSAQGCQKILAWETYNGKGIDNLFSKNFKGYCVFPMICFQNDSVTSDLADIRFHFDKLAGIEARNTSTQKLGAHSKYIKKQYFSILENLHKTLLFR